MITDIILNMNDSTNIENTDPSSGINLPESTPNIRDLESTSSTYTDSINFAGHTAISKISYNVHEKATNVLKALDNVTDFSHFTVLSAMNKQQRLRFESNCINYFYEKIASNQDLKSINATSKYSKLDFTNFLQIMRNFESNFTTLTTEERVLLDVMSDSILHAYEVTSEVNIMNIFDSSAQNFINSKDGNVIGLTEALQHHAVRAALVNFHVKNGDNSINEVELKSLIPRASSIGSVENPEFQSLKLLREIKAYLDLEESINALTLTDVEKSNITKLVELRKRFDKESDASIRSTINSDITSTETALGSNLSLAQDWYDLNHELKSSRDLSVMYGELQTNFNSVYLRLTASTVDSSSVQNLIDGISPSASSSADNFEFVDPLKFAAIIRTQSYIEAGIDDASARKKAALDVVSDKLHFDFVSLRENEKDIDLAKNCKEIALDALIANMTIDKFAFKDDAGYQKLMGLLSNRSNAKMLQTDPVKFFTQHVNSSSIDLSSIEKFVSILLPFARGIQLTNNRDELKMQKADLKQKISELKLDSSVNPQNKASNTAQIKSLKAEIQSLNLEISKQNAVTSKSKQRFAIVKKSERYDLLRIVRAFNLLQVSESANKIASQADVDINKLDQFVPDTVRGNISESKQLNPNRSGISRFRALAMNCFGKGYKMSDIKPHANILTKGFFGTLEGIRKLGAFSIKSPFSKLGLTAAAASFLFMPALSIPYIGATASPYVTSYLTGVLGSGMQALYGKSKNYLAPRTKASFGRFKQGRIYRSGAWTTKAGVGVFNHLLNPVKYKEAIVDPFSRNFVDLFTPSKGLIGPLAGLALGTPWNVITHAAKTLWFKK
jgi:hypothetical protein